MESPVRRQYGIEELLLLSKSPLIRKPEGLPPIEEWMGPTPAVRPQTTRGRTDGDVLPNSTNHEDLAKGITATRRPSLFVSRSSIPEDIILGPPKMSFVSSSSARTPTGKFDQDPLHASSVASPVFVEERGESPHFERFKIERGIRSGDKDRGDKDRGGDRGDMRGGNHIKRGFRDDAEGGGGGAGGGGWTNVSRQPRKSFGAEDGDRFRRDRGEREKRETPWDKDRPPKYDNFGRDRDREHRPKLKRDESSWLLDDNRGGDRDRDRDHYRDRDRDHHRDSHRDNHRYNNSRTEKDPEWMDSGPSNEDRTGDAKTAHSMEEFQRWKERMKAGNAPPDEKKKVDLPIDETHQTPPPREEAEAKPVKENGSAIIEEPQTAPAVVENGVDRFFGFWSTPANKSAEQDILNTIRQEPKNPVKSRFAAIFAPQDETIAPPQVEAPKPSPGPPTPADGSTSEDKEGFQRILKILNGVSIGDNTNPVPAQAPPQAPVVQRPMQRSISPITSSLMSPPPAPSHQNQANAGLRNDPNTDFFMRLMHQSHQSQQHQVQLPPSVSPLHQHYGGPSQMPPPPPISTSPHNYHRVKNNPLSPVYDDPAITDFRRRDASPIYPRGPPLMEQHGPPAGWNPQQQQQMSQPPPPQSLRQVAPPPGLARNQHHQGPPPPPPFLGPPPLGVNGPPMPFQLGPMPPNIPPNFGPPPPFFNMNGPPPQMNGPPPLGYHMPPFHHHHHEPPHGPPMGIHGPPFGFPHEGVKSPPHPHGPGNTRFSAESIHRQIR